MVWNESKISEKIIKLRTELRKIAYSGLYLGHNRIIRNLEEIPYVRMGAQFPVCERAVDLGGYVTSDTFVEAVYIFTEANGEQFISNKTIFANCKRKDDYLSSIKSREELDYVKDKLISYIETNYPIKGEKCLDGILFRIHCSSF